MSRSTESVFSRLSRYAASSQVRPLENFTTELLAWTVNRWPSVGTDLVRLYVPTVERGASVSARTQKGLEGYGIADLWLDVHSEGRSLVLLIENKVDSSIGARDPTETEDDLGAAASSHPAQSGNQIEKYLAFAVRAKTPCFVGLLSKVFEAPSDRWVGPAWVGAHRWFQIDDLLRSSVVREHDLEFLHEIRAFLREEDMVLDAVDSSLAGGTQQRVRLLKLFEEAADRVARELGLARPKRPAGADRWGVWVSWLHGRRHIGLGYSDLRSDTALFFPPGSLSEAEVAQLRAIPGLEVIRSAGGGGFWGYPHLPLIDFNTDGSFFGLQAAEQIERIRSAAAEKLRIIVDTLQEVSE